MALLSEQIVLSQIYLFLEELEVKRKLEVDSRGVLRVVYKVCLGRRERRMLTCLVFPTASTVRIEKGVLPVEISFSIFNVS